MERKYAIDFLKIVGMILIIFHHYQQMVGLYFNEGVNFYGGAFYFGLLVEFFFLLSGFVLVKYIEPICNGMSFAHFFGKRYFRLIPMTAIAAVVYELLGVLYNTIENPSYIWILSPVKLDIWGTIQTALGMQVGGIFPEVRYINNPTWYISVLLLCYAFFYMIVRICHNKGISPLYLFLGMIFLGVAIGTHSIQLPLLNAFTRRGYYAFFFGLILGKMYEKRESTILEALLAIVAGITASMYIMRNGYANVYAPEYLMTFVVYAAIVVIVNTSLAKRVFRHRIWGELGSISFNTYVWHLVVLFAVYVIFSMMNLTVNLKSGYAMLLYTAVSFLVGAISHYFLEKPIAKWLFERVDVIKKLEKFFEKV